MILKAFSIVDMKAGVHCQPFFFVHKAHAVRAVVATGYDMQTDIGKYPYEFRLVCIGEFDDAAGVLLSTPHEDLGTIGSLMAAEQRISSREKSVDLATATASEVVEHYEGSIGE